MVTQTYTVAGLTCGACIGEVMERVRLLPGVRGMSIDYRPGSPAPLLVESRSGIPLERLRETLGSAGFEVSAASRRRARQLRRRLAADPGSQRLLLPAASGSRQANDEG